MGDPSAAVKRCGCLSPFSPVHSKKPLAGMMAAPSPERLAEHWFLGDAFGAGVEGRRHFLERFFPEERHQAPAHRDELALAFRVEAHYVHGVRRGDIVMRAQIARRAEHAQERMHFFPGVVLSESSAARL